MKTDIPVLKRGLMYTGGKLKDELLDKYWKRAFVCLAVSVVLLFFVLYSCSKTIQFPHYQPPKKLSLFAV
jgi:hypothetical protein